jgi:hypothetical protein
MSRKKNYKGRCLEAAYDAAFKAIETNDSKNVFIVHANLDLIGLHAWVEVGNMVYDLTKGEEPIEKSWYYEKAQVSESSLNRYSFHDFCKLIGETGRFGPWEIIPNER